MLRKKETAAGNPAAVITARPSYASSFGALTAASANAPLADLREASSVTGHFFGSKCAAYTSRDTHPRTIDQNSQRLSGRSAK
jgi:hypothetical protein